jgi:hypothetical protein
VVASIQTTTFFWQSTWLRKHPGQEAVSPVLARSATALITAQDLGYNAFLWQGGIHEQDDED